MTIQIGLPVVYADQNGNQVHASIDSFTGTTANLLVFVSADAGYRNDQQAVPYAETPTAGCWSFLNLS